MFHKFYGLTAVDLILSGMSLKLYSKCLEDLQNEPEVLFLLSEQFKRIKKVVAEIPYEYIDPKDKRIAVKLRLLEKSNPNDPMIKEYENQLEGKPKDIAPFVYVNGDRVEISDVSKTIILKLKNSTATIDRFMDLIQVNKVSEKEVLFFNQPLYRLKNFSRGRLNLIMSSFVRSHITRTGLTDDFWNYIDRFIAFVNNYVGDEETSSVDLSKSLVSDVGNFIDKLDYSYLNLVLGLECNEEDYHKASIELYNVGLVGFTPFFKEFYREFLNSFKPNYASDVKVSTSSDLYKFVQDLKRASDSNHKLGEYFEDNQEVEINL